MSSKNKKVQSSAAAAADEHHHQDSIVPASSDSTSTTAAGSSFTASSSIPSTNPSTTTNEADNIDNEPSASSVAISSLKETGQQLLKDALKVEPQQLMNSLKEQGQAAYMQLSLPQNLNPFGSVIGGGGDDEVVAAKAESSKGAIVEKGVAAESTKKLATTNTTSSARSTKSYQKSTSQPTEPTFKSGSALQDSGNSKINVSSPDKKSKDKGTSGDVKDSDKDDTDSLVDDTDLKQAYPLLLQRSASSAFGSPDKSSKGSKMRARRAHSNSGSDINSAFHPVWSCKSLSTGSSHGSISGSNIDGSEVGSAVSSSIAASTIRSAHSDPFPSIQFGAASDNTNSPSKKRSPWKKLFKNRMKNREKWASFSKREQSLSGRENPARPDLIGDEDERAYMSVTVLEGASEEPASPVKASSTQKKKKKKGKKGSSSSTSSGSKKSAATKKQGNVSQAVAKDEKQYDDPPVALNMSDSDEENDDAFEPIGDYSLNERPPSIVPPSQLGNRPEKKQAETPLSFDVPCDSVEVISTSVTPTPFGQSSSQSTNIQVVSPNSIEENSPPTVERVTVVIEEAPYHPLGGDEEKASGPSEAVETAVSQSDEASNVAAKLKYRSPKRSSSRASSGGSSIQHQSNSHQHSPSSMGHVSTDTSRLSSEGSPSSRISSSNSRFSGASSGLNSGGDRTINTLQSGEGSLVVDSTNYEIREANRRSGIRVRTLGGDSQEVMSGHDGNDTVFSSSTTSSNYHTSSPRKLRDGATMPVDRFFAGGNVAMSPSPQRYTMSSAASSGDGSSRASPGISRFLSSPKTLTRIGASGMSNSTSSSKDTNSPQTVSSNSVANSSSSGSEAKKPLQFVAYETVREEGESPFDEEPLDSKDGRETSPSNTKSSLIKPRISNVIRSSRRPPLGSPQKPPQSPRVKPNSLSYGRARTPTRTPPPSSYRETGGASTPCSPPAIIDNLALGDLSLKTTKPLVLRRSSSVPQSRSGEPMLLINPGSPGRREYPWPHRRAQHQVPPIPPQTNRLRTEMTVVGEEDGAQEVTVVSPTNSSSPLQAKADMNDAKGVAVVSPEKGF